MIDIFAAWPIVIALIGAGITAGLLAGLLGLGGGLVIVPALYYLLPLFDVSTSSAMAIATATSLATIIPTALSSTRAHLANGNVDVSVLKLWAPFIFISAIFGSLLAANLSGQILSIVFAVLVMYASLRMFRSANKNTSLLIPPPKWLQAGMACCVGGISVIVGIGGATIGMPLLSRCHIQPHKAVGTAAAFGLFIALPGTVTLLIFGQTPADAPVGTWHLINWPAFMLIVPLSMFFAPIGAKLGSYLNAQQLRRVFAIFLLFTGVRMILKATSVL